MQSIRHISLLGVWVLLASSCVKAPATERLEPNASADRVERIESALSPRVVVEGRELETRVSSSACRTLGYRASALP